MSDKTKKPPTNDLTGILQYAKKMQDSGQAAEAPKGMIMDEVPIEKIDDFESLDDYASSNPMPEPKFETTFDTSTDEVGSGAQANPLEGNNASATHSSPQEQVLNSTEFSSSEFATTDFAAAEPGLADVSSSEFVPSDFSTTEPAATEFSTSDFATSDFSTGDLAPAEPLETEASVDPTTAALENSGTGETQPNSENKSSDALNSKPNTAPAPTSSANTSLKTKKLDSAEKLTFKSDTPTPPTHALENVKKYSEQLPNSKSPVPASFPFSILIRGELRPEEKEKLLSLLEDHQMGFRLIDLEPQLASGRILIPRISEYAGVLIIQALRGTRAEMKLGTSDSIFSTADTRATEEETFSSSTEETSSSHSSELTHPAESIPVTPLDHLPGSPKVTLIDTVTANATLRSTVVEAEHSSAFQEIVEALQREIKYKAYRKGATAVLDFKIQINNLSSPTHYRIMALGSAVKPKSGSSTVNLEPSPNELSK